MSTTVPEADIDSPISRALAETEHEGPAPVIHADPEPEPEVDPEDETDEVEEHDSQLDDIELQMANREWVVDGSVMMKKARGHLSEETWRRVYVQKPLSFAGMLQFTGLIGDRISQAMSGPDGLSLDGIINADEAPSMAAILGRDDFAGVDAFVKGIAKLAMYVPDVIEDCQCIWLRVPFHERPIVKEIWSRSPEDGGLTFENGEEMLEIFLAQNYQEVEAFFGVRLPRLLKKVQKLRERAADRSQPSKPSKRIPADTPSQ